MHYLSDEDLMREIEQSKLSYCSDGINGQRVYTNEHIPEKAVRRGRAPILDAFKEWRDGCVVRQSHWTGDVSRGRYCITHGRLTEKLGGYILLMAERISERNNFTWRPDKDEMKDEAILKMTAGALRFRPDRSSSAFAYMSQIAIYGMLSVIGKDKDQREIRERVKELAEWDLTDGTFRGIRTSS